MTYHQEFTGREAEQLATTFYRKLANNIHAHSVNLKYRVELDRGHLVKVYTVSWGGFHLEHEGAPHGVARNT